MGNLDRYKPYLQMLIVKGSSLVALFLLQVLLARTLGLKAFGEYSYIISLITIASLFCIWGGERFLIKQVAIFNNRKQWNHYSKLTKNFFSIVLVNSFFVSLLIIGYLYFAPNSHYSPLELTIIALLLYVVSISRISASISKGLGFVTYSELIFTLGRPVFIIVILLMSALFFSINIATILGITLLSYLLIHIIMWRKNSALTKSKVTSKRSPHILSYYKKAFPFLIIGLGFPLMVNLDIIVLGFFEKPESIAIYVASSKIIGIVLIGLTSANLLIAPKLPVLYKDNKMNEFIALIRRNNIFIFVVTLVPVLILGFYGRDILRVFGEEYTKGHDVLLILLLSQSFNVIFGPVNLVAVMTGYQKISSYMVIIVCFLEFLLCIILIPKYGILGAAYSNLIAYFTINFALAILIKVKLGVNVTLTNLIFK